MLSGCSREAAQVMDVGGVCSSIMILSIVRVAVDDIHVVVVVVVTEGCLLQSVQSLCETLKKEAVNSVCRGKEVNSMKKSYNIETK